MSKIQTYINYIADPRARRSIRSLFSIFLNDDDPTTFKGITIGGSLTIGAASSDLVTFTARMGSQLYHNLSGQSYTVLKIHNHNTTAETGSLDAKGEFINLINSMVGVGSYWSYEPTGLTGTPTGVTASENVVALAPLHIVTTGNLYGLTGHAQQHGTLNGAAVNMAGVVGVIEGAGANTLCLHIAGVQSALMAGFINPTAGTLSHFLANNTGTCVADNLLCMQASQYITNFASFNEAAADKCVEANSTTLTLTPTAYHIRVLIAGTPYYIPCFVNKTWAA